MAEEPLDRRISREIRERLKESRAAVLEYQRLEAALQALNKMDGNATTKTRPRHSTSRRTSTRAPRGANREKALAAIREEPGISVAELSAATGITKKVLYGLTRTLTERGVVERVDAADGAVGFRVAEPAEAEAIELAGDGEAGSEATEAPKRRRRTRGKPAETTAESASGLAAPSARAQERAESV
jgi:hypothetical protein